MVRFLRWMAAQTRHYAFAAFLIVGTAWAWWYYEAQEGLERPMLEITKEIRTMISWDHTLPTGGTIHIEVYRRDYESDEAWLSAVSTLQATYPPNG